MRKFIFSIKKVSVAHILPLYLHSSFRYFRWIVSLLDFFTFFSMHNSCSFSLRIIHISYKLFFFSSVILRIFASGISRKLRWFKMLKLASKNYLKNQKIRQNSGQFWSKIRYKHTCFRGYHGLLKRLCFKVHFHPLFTFISRERNYRLHIWLLFQAHALPRCCNTLRHIHSSSSYVWTNLGESIQAHGCTLPEKLVDQSSLRSERD